MGGGDSKIESEQMTKLHLKFVQSFGGYHYFRRAGYPRIRLAGIVGSQEFLSAYQAALGTEPTPIGKDKRSKPGSVGAVITSYFQSRPFFLDKYRPATQAKHRASLERLGEEDGDLPIRLMPKKFIVAMLDTMAPHSAKNWLKAVRGLMQYCLKYELIREDPTLGIKIKTPKSDGHHAWTADEILQFETFHPIGSKARLALALGLYTAQRRGDVVHMGRQHIRDGWLHVKQEKTGKPLDLPIYLTELPAIINATPCGHLTLLTTKTGKSYGANDFSEQFRKWCDDAGLPQRCTFHGLRKAALTRLADAGKNIHQIASVSGHKTLKEIQHYTEAFDQKRLALEAMAKTAAAEQNGSKTVKPDDSGLSKPLKALAKK
jgi:integrase